MKVGDALAEVGWFLARMLLLLLYKMRILK